LAKYIRVHVTCVSSGFKVNLEVSDEMQISGTCK